MDGDQSIYCCDNVVRSHATAQAHQNKLFFQRDLRSKYRDRVETVSDISSQFISGWKYTGLIESLENSINRRECIV